MSDQDFKVSDDSLSYYLSLKYLIEIYPEDRGFTVMIPDLPGCMSQGKTLDEAMMNIYKAKHLWLETVHAKNKASIPLPSK
ncbi:MAG: type II toxin-antitoxin system HicB family antitoxin [Cyanobacteria bacterium P01_G01_bin.67]